MQLCPVLWLISHCCSCVQIWRSWPLCPAAVCPPLCSTQLSSRNHSMSGPLQQMLQVRQLSLISPASSSSFYTHPPPQSPHPPALWHESTSLQTSRLTVFFSGCLNAGNGVWIAPRLPDSCFTLSTCVLDKYWVFVNASYPLNLCSGMCEVQILCIHCPWPNETDVSETSPITTLFSFSFAHIVCLIILLMSWFVEENQFVCIASWKPTIAC